MVRFKIICTVLILLNGHTISSESNSTTILHKSFPYPQTATTPSPSLFARIANWLLPFGSDQTAAAGEHHNQYLPPPQAQYYQDDCNSCNNEPWIPIASNLGQSTVVKFVPPSVDNNQLYQSSHNFGLDHIRPPVAVNYSPPPRVQFRPRQPNKNFGLPVQYKPSPTLSDYVVPPPPLHFKRKPIVFRPQPVKDNSYYQQMHPPPPVDQYGPPVNQYGPPADLYGPPSINSYHSPPTLATFHQQRLPPAVPSDSYGAPVTGINANYPAEQLPLPSENGPIPIPNLSSFPVLPIRDNTHFRQEESQIQIVPSVQIANFVSSIEHPVNVIQSPIVDLDVKEEESKTETNYKLSENPIVVEDTFTASSNINNTYTDGKEKEAREQEHMSLLKQLLLQQGIGKTQIVDIKKAPIENKTSAPVVPTMSYGNWVPYQSSLAGEMLPPPISASTWLIPVNKSTVTTKKPKRIQIIVPYVTHKPPVPFTKSNQNQIGAYTTLVPVYMPPSSTSESLWSKFMDDFKLAESKAVSASAFKPQSTTSVNNIRDLLSGTGIKPTVSDYSKLPYDIISLQKTIDDWTQQEFSKKPTNADSLAKKIPNEYFTTQPSISYLAAGTNAKEFSLPAKNQDIETNFIENYSSTTTEESSSTTTLLPETTEKEVWKSAQVTVSGKEKVYVVTPESHKVFDNVTPATAWSLAPKIENGKLNNDATFSSKKFSIRVEPENKESRTRLKKDHRGAVKIVYSEWPHLINNLKTTTTPQPTTRHPLFGLMAFPSNTTNVETFDGHSKVVVPSSIKKTI